MYSTYQNFMLIVNIYFYLTRFSKQYKKNSLEISPSQYAHAYPTIFPLKVAISTFHPTPTNKSYQLNNTISHTRKKMIILIYQQSTNPMKMLIHTVTHKF